MRTIYRVVSTIYNGDTREINYKMFKDKRTASRMCAVRNQSNICTSMYCISISTTRFYDVYAIYRNHRLYGSNNSISILDISASPKLIHIANSLEDALDYIDNKQKDQED